MKLVFIYGSPAAGKLTISRELAKITGFKIFHNHIVNDLLDEFLESNEKYYWESGAKLKTLLVDLLASSKIKGLIVTMVYGGGPLGLNIAKKMKQSIQKNSGKFCCVKLICDKKELLCRVKGESRKNYNKVNTKKKLLEGFKEFGMDNSLPFKNQLIINNTNVPAKKVAKQIKEHYHL